jgi:hypothetical protein
MKNEFSIVRVCLFSSGLWLESGLCFLEDSEI